MNRAISCKIPKTINLWKAAMIWTEGIGVISGISMNQCSVAGHKLAYYRSGRGEPVLLLHGITTYSFIWNRIFPKLAENHDVIALDLLGCGNSDMPLDVSYALKDHADVLHGFVTALDLPPFHLVGHDLGGGIGQIFAINHPEKLIDLSLLNTVAYDFWPVQPISAMRTPIVRQFLMASLDLGMFRLVVKRGVFNPEKVTSELMDSFMAPFKTQAGRKAFLHFARCLDNHNLMEIEEQLQKLALPVLILRGENDQYLSAEISFKLHREIPDSRLSVLPNAGHFFQEDVPELIVAELDSFFGLDHG
jgi:pimeloyl-ACP methyl ester carboxylesterase